MIAICVNADVKNQGYDKVGDCHSHNSYYTDIQDTNLEKNPLMKFDDFEDEEEDAEENNQYVLV